MVDLTYLCFVFLNDRSDAWWEMQWAACQGRDNSRERARESCIHSQFTPISAVFKVSNFFFFLHYYWLLREQLFPSLLPFRITILTLTDRQLMGKLTACMRRSNSAMKLMCCIKGNMWQSSGKWRGSRYTGHSLGSAWTGSEWARWSGPLWLNVGSSSQILPVFLYFLLYLLMQLFIYLFILFPSHDRLVLAAHNNLAAFHSLEEKHWKPTDTFLIFRGMYEGGQNNRIIPNSIIQHQNHENESMSLWHCKTDNGGICYLVDFNYGLCFVVLYLTGVPATASNFNIRAWSIKVQFYYGKS